MYVPLPFRSSPQPRSEPLSQLNQLQVVATMTHLSSLVYPPLDVYWLPFPISSLQVAVNLSPLFFGRESLQRTNTVILLFFVFEPRSLPSPSLLLLSPAANNPTQYSTEVVDESIALEDDHKINRSLYTFPFESS